MRMKVFTLMLLEFLHWLRGTELPESIYTTPERHS